jgi:hypothetical protein
MPIGTPQGNLDIKNATLRTSNLETQNIKIGSIFVGTGVYSLEETANVGNSMSNTIQFTNTHTAFTTTGNVEVGTDTLFVDSVNNRVGVGTTSPDKLLEISGASGLDNLSPVHFRITNTQSATNSSPFTDITKPSGLISFYTPDTSTAGPGDVAGIGFRHESTLGGDTALCFYTNSENDDAGTPLQERMCITHDGNVGIGKTDPATKLHVEHYGSAIGDFEGIRIANHATNLHASSRPAYEFVVSDIDAGTGLGNGKFAIGYRGTTSASRTDRLVIDNSGNVGIGTTSPTDRLDVHYPNPSYGSFAGTEEGSLTVSAGAEHSNAAIYFRTPFDAAAPAKRAIFSDGGGYSGGSSGGLHFCLESTNDNTTKVDLTDSKMVIKQNGDVGIGTTPSEKFHVHENLPTSGHQIMARIGGDTSSYNTLVFGSKEGRPHIGGHRGDFGAWSDLSLQNDTLIISQSGNIVNVNGTFRIQGYDTKRVPIGYQKYSSSTGVSYASGTSGYQDAWSVTYTRVHSGSQIYIIGDLCLAQALGATGTTSYRAVIGRLKVNSGGVDYYSDSVQDWQRIDNSFHEYQRQSRVHFNQQALSGTTAGQNITIYAQVEEGGRSGTTNSFGLNIWAGRSYIEVFEVM